MNISQQIEFEWVLHVEVHSVLKNLHTLLVVGVLVDSLLFLIRINFFKIRNLPIFQECAHRFPVPLYGNDGRKQDKFILTVPQDNLKCVVTLTGDSISHAVSITLSYLMIYIF